LKAIKKIMVACDLSPHAARILDYALCLADTTKAPLTLVHVINRRDLEAIEYAVHKMHLVAANVAPEDYIRQFCAEREEALRAQIKKTGQAKRFAKVMVKTGVPSEELLAATRSEQVDLVIMGTKGRTNIQSVIAGATAEKMFRLCPVPLLSVPLFKT